jgi:hypothetical protein
VAKRSVKKARDRTPGQPASAPADPQPSRRGFWLGVLVAAAILVPAGVIGVVLAASGGDDDPAAQQQEQVAEEVESEAETLRRQTQVRDKEQVQELTDRMRSTADDLAPVLAGFARTLPPGEDSVGPLPRAAQVERWDALVKEADEFFAETVSGETGTNVARGGFGAALDALIEATGSLQLALEQPDIRDRLLEQARRQRDLGVRTWGVAATQLDAINIATGFGHQHVYLGGPGVEGSFGADPAPEGSGAEDPGDR